MRQENVRSFGTMPDGTQVDEILLSDGRISAGILTYGGAVRTLVVPDRTGRAVDVVLGFDALEDYRSQDKYIGALVGRCANRIGGGRFELGGETYELLVNNGPNHLHGGGVGFDRQVWTLERASADQAVLSLRSPHGQEGYPGTLDVQVTYALEDGALSIHYQAVSDRDTVCNLTNHTYFDLSGHSHGSILDHQVRLCAQRYTPADETSIPTGQILPVAGTPMDLLQPVRVGDRIDQPFGQLVQAKGYDHNWVVDGEPGQLRMVGAVYAQDTGIELEVESTQPGVQFYTGNYLAGCPRGKGGAFYGDRSGLCLETQDYPDAINHPGFPSPVLRAGETYDHTTIYRFGVR